MKKLLNEFKDFMSKGNVLNLAIGLIMGGLFTKIVNSFANEILMPLISLLVGKTAIEDMFVALDGNFYQTIEDARAAGAAVIGYGSMIQLLIDFLITTLCLFFFIKIISFFKEKSEKLAKAAADLAQDIIHKNDEEKEEEEEEEEAPAEEPVVELTTTEKLLTEILGYLKKDEPVPEELLEVIPSEINKPEHIEAI